MAQKAAEAALKNASKLCMGAQYATFASFALLMKLLVFPLDAGNPIHHKKPRV